ncbi:MAG TPA: choice-of-anchor D domain-containing protein [Myxococcales bacterium]|nr:choice-of-anchor D domain-containing protein [Myxococcales bacterium]
MRVVRWIAFTLLASASACNCAHKGSDDTLLSKDSTPDVTPNPVKFGNVPVGSKVLQEVTLENTGQLELDISSVTIVQPSGGGPAEFGFGPLTNLQAPFGTALLQNGKASVNLFCQPSAAGTQSGSLIIKSNSDADGTYTVPLTCNGTSVEISEEPSPVDFGNVQVGTTSTLSVALTNQGSSASDPVTLQPVTGTQAAEFSYTGYSGTPSPLSPGGTLTIQVTFAPTAQGPATALIEYTYCAQCTAQVITLIGTGVDGQLVYSPNPISFYSVPAGSTVTVPGVSLIDVGTAAVQISSLALSNGSSSAFSISAVSQPLPATLQPDGPPLTFTVSYTATSAGNDVGEVDATWLPLDGSGAPVTGIAPRFAPDPISGNGTLNPCTLQIKPPSLNFGNVTVGASTTLPVTLTNVGQQQCSVSGVAIGAGSDPAFTLAGGAPTTFTIAPAANQTIAVQCDVASSNPPLLHRGSLTFATTDPNQANVAVPLTAYIKGSGPYQNGWPKWHNDNTDQGQSLADTSGNQGTVIWQFRMAIPQSAGGLLGSVNPNPTYMNSPVVDASGNVYQLGMDGTFWAIDPGGNELWSTPLLPPNPDEHPATPIIAADGTIYIETGTDGLSAGGGQLYQIDSSTGKIISQVGPPTEQSCYGGQCSGADGFDVNPSIGNDGMLFDGDDFGQVVTYTIGATSFSQTNAIILEFFGERVAVALDQNDNSYWCSLNVCFGVSSPAAGFTQMASWPSSGQTIGSAAGSGLTGWTNSDIAYDENHTGWLIAEAGTQTGSTGQTWVSALDPTNGAVHWSTSLPSGPTPGSFDALTEAGIFSSDVGNSAPAISTFSGQSNDGIAYVGNVDGLHALDVHTGAEVAGWPFKTTSDVDSAPAIGGDGTIFFGTADGTFYAVNPNGTQRFSFSAGARISSSPAIGPDGTVFFIADNGQLYALR